MSLQGLPAELEAEVVSADVNPAAIGRLTRVFQRRLACRLAEQGYGELSAARHVSWLSPRSSWLSTAVLPERALTAEEAADIRADFRAGGTGVAPELYVVDQQNASAWHHDLVARVQRDMCSVQNDAELRVAAPWLPAAEGTNVPTPLAAALAVIPRVWPGAAVELRLLIRSILLLEGTDLSASMDQVFGVIFFSTEYLGSTPSTFEILLHETGHHSLFVRLAFDPFVTNPDELVHHPLRTDPRPIIGTLHAGHVLYRIAAGFDRWCAADPDAGAEVHRRRDAAVEKLTATLGVLADRADWTEVGTRYFGDLTGRAALLRSSVPA